MRRSSERLRWRSWLSRETRGGYAESSISEGMLKMTLRQITQDDARPHYEIEITLVTGTYRMELLTRELHPRYLQARDRFLSLMRSFPIDEFMMERAL